MKLVIEGSEKEVLKILQTIGNSQEQMLNESLAELQQKTIDRLTEAISVYGSFQRTALPDQPDNHQQ